MSDRAALPYLSGGSALSGGGGQPCPEDPLAVTRPIGMGTTPPAVAPPNPPAAPPGYQLGDLVGYGGMGQVYRAAQRHTGRSVAVKYMTARANPTAGLRFRVEVQAVARVTHPNVVAVYAADLDAADPYFVMEYVPNGSLARRLLPGPLPPAEAARVIAQAARGVAAAHAAGVLHRDLKPGNILFAADGTAKVADFGLARSLDDAQHLTAIDSHVGTPCYMSPEQAVGGRDGTGPAADVYGLGASLYEAVTGRPPFRGATALATLDAVRTSPPTAPRSVRPEVPIDLEAICLKCLEKRADDRYKSAADLAADLDRYLAGEPTIARPPSVARKAGRWAKRHGRPVATAALAVAAVIGMALAVAPPRPDASARAAVGVQADLRADRPVTLIGPTGPPRLGPVWQAGGGSFPPPEAERAFAFDGAGQPAYLQLLADPGVDRYTLTAEIRQRPGARGTISPGDVVGLYIGRPTEGAAVLLHIGEYEPTVDLPPGPLRDLRSVQLRWQAGNHGHLLGQARHTPAPLGATPWRVLELVVTPDRLTARWRPSPESLPAIVAEVTFDQMDTAVAALVPVGSAADRWSPRASIGLYAHRGTVDVRNLTITPRPRTRAIVTHANN